MMQEMAYRTTSCAIFTNGHKLKGEKQRQLWTFIFKMPVTQLFWNNFMPVIQLTLSIELKGDQTRWCDTATRDDANNQSTQITK